MSLDKRIKTLCDLFQCSAQMGYRKDQGDFYVALNGVYRCVETGSTARLQDGTTKTLLAAGHSLSGYAATLSEAVAKIENSTIKNGRCFIVSNQTFGLFSMNDDDGEHIISVYEGKKKVDSFAYNEDTLRAALLKYAPR